MSLKDEITVGLHRPVYMWAGPGTIRMNRLKFMGAPVDEFVHEEAHRSAGARRMAQGAGFNWAYLTYDWGFPPEVEQEDRNAFRQAVKTYHAEGLHVFGYIQTSNCVYSGTYLQKDWYALDRLGRLVYYYTGRYMTCWLHPEWREHLREMTRGVIEAGADGVFFDNPWHGSQPLLFWGTWMGSAGCACPRCRKAFRATSGLEIPDDINPERDEVSRCYLEWRAGQVTHAIGELRDYAHSLKADVLVSVNDFDAVMRPSYLVYGIDLKGLASAQDVLMIEDYGLPRWQREEPPQPALLINNALTLRIALALAGNTPLTTNPYDKGIGFDDVFPPRRFLQGIAEAAACGVPMVVKGTEYVADGRFTLLTAERYVAQRLAIGRMNRWLGSHAGLYRERQNLADIGLAFPGAALWQDWTRLAPCFFWAGQVLLHAGLPWRVVSEQQHLEGLRILFTFGALPAGLSLPESMPESLNQNLQVIDMTALPGWELPNREILRPAILQRHPILERPVSAVVVEIYRSYFHSRLARKLLDRLGLTHFFLQSPYFRLPGKRVRKVLLSAVSPTQPAPWVQAEAPLLVELWGQGGQIQLHLVNYADEPQPVTVAFDQFVHGHILTPDGEEWAFEGLSVSFVLDVYAILIQESE